MSNSRLRLGRAQANILYDHLAALPPGTGVTLRELMVLADTSEERVRHLLASIRRGAVNEEGRYKKRLPPLNIHHHRGTDMYYNMSNMDEDSVEDHVPAGVVEELIANILARGDSLRQVLGITGGGILEQAAKQGDEERLALLSQIPLDKLDDVVEVLNDIQVARRLLEMQRRGTERGQRGSDAPTGQAAPHE